MLCAECISVYLEPQYIPSHMHTPATSDVYRCKINLLNSRCNVCKICIQQTTKARRTQTVHIAAAAGNKFVSFHFVSALRSIWTKFPRIGCNFFVNFAPIDAYFTAHVFFFPLTRLHLISVHSDQNGWYAKCGNCWRIYVSIQIFCFSSDHREHLSFFFTHHFAKLFQSIERLLNKSRNEFPNDNQTNVENCKNHFCKNRNENCNVGKAKAVHQRFRLNQYCISICGKAPTPTHKIENCLRRLQASTRFNLIWISSRWNILLFSTSYGMEFVTFRHSAIPPLHNAHSFFIFFFCCSHRFAKTFSTYLANAVCIRTYRNPFTQWLNALTKHFDFLVQNNLNSLNLWHIWHMDERNITNHLFFLLISIPLPSPSSSHIPHGMVRNIICVSISHLSFLAVTRSCVSTAAAFSLFLF